MTRCSKKSKKQKEELTNEERELFLDAFFQGDPGICDKYAKNPERLVDFVQRDETDLDHSDRELFLQAINEGLKDAFPQHKRPPSPRAKSPLPTKKRQLVDATIDLHGMTAEDAIVALHRFLDQEYVRGGKTILVIHGKGAGILKKAVWQAVDVHPLVDDFQIAAGRLGGHGAIVVRINRKRRG